MVPAKYTVLSRAPCFHCRNVPSTIVSDMLAQYLPVMECITLSIAAKYANRNMMIGGTN